MYLGTVLSGMTLCAIAEPEKNIDENTGQTNGLLSFCAMIITHNYPACNGGVQPHLPSVVEETEKD